MEYKKIIQDNYNTHLIKTDRFKTITIEVSFSNIFSSKDIPFLNLLITMLTSSTKKYKTTQALSTLGEDLYGSVVYSSYSIFGGMEKLNVSLTFLNPKYTEKIMLKKSIDFLKECLLNPNVINDEFDKQLFEINKSNIINSLKSIKDNPYMYSFINFKNIMYEGFPNGYHLYNNINDMKKIKNKDLYDFYKKVIKNFKIDVFVVGNIENETEYIKHIDKIFSKISNNHNTQNNYQINFTSINKKIIKEKGDFSQSQLFIGYCFKDLTDYEKNYVINLYNAILGGINNSLLFTEIREKNSLCYSINSSITKEPYSIIVETEIDKSNINKTILLVDKVIKMMGDERNIKDLYDTAKEYIKTSLNAFYDNQSVMVEHYLRKEFVNSDDIETKRKKYMEITIKDIVKLNSKIRKSITYFLEGKKENE